MIRQRGAYLGCAVKGTLEATAKRPPTASRTRRDFIGKLHGSGVAATMPSQSY